jgi:hypothetical protein
MRLVGIACHALLARAKADRRITSAGASGL